MSRVVRRIASAFGALALITSTSSFTAAPAQADPGICIDHVMANGYEPTADVLYACKVGKTGLRKDVRKCHRILLQEGVDHRTARHACRIASEPDPEPAPA